MTSSEDRLFEAEPLKEHGSVQDTLAEMLKLTFQTTPTHGLSAHFSQRVAEEADRRARRRHREEQFFRKLMVLLLSGLIGCAVLGWLIAKPTALLRLLDGPVALVLTALTCLVVGGLFANKPRQPGIAKPTAN